MMRPTAYFMPLCLCLPLLLCGACAGPSGAAAAQAPQAPQTYRENVALTGQIAVHYQQNGEQQHMSGNYNWLQQDSKTSVTLSSPLGQTVAQIEVTPQAATLTQAGQAPRSAPNVDRLTTEVLGWPLPVSGLRHWLQGRATGADGQPFVASPQHDSVYTADGWHLRYVWGDQHAAFKRIELERSVPAQAADVSLRITVAEAH